ncbi:MAG: hypothetical protein D6E12_10050 [Desulfovibrio sp.]|nr:MAG: hypothetical protein D6E12_10050 [Desulfovibrio sp.]
MIRAILNNPALMVSVWLDRIQRWGAQPLGIHIALLAVGCGVMLLGLWLCPYGYWGWATAPVLGSFALWVCAYAVALNRKFTGSRAASIGTVALIVGACCVACDLLHCPEENIYALHYAFTSQMVLILLLHLYAPINLLRFPAWAASLAFVFMGLAVLIVCLVLFPLYIVAPGAKGWPSTHLVDHIDAYAPYYVIVILMAPYLLFLDILRMGWRSYLFMVLAAVPLAGNHFRLFRRHLDLNSLLCFVVLWCLYMGLRYHDQTRTRAKSSPSQSKQRHSPSPSP